ncbi:ABC transporter ATP-binding protein [Paenibacillus assamensis]|uniref:ABC transporter ATP-binding protein n=1 Tax=Paenibacillus assamensis TaxID=311244 RepID=UPI00041C8C12|nr:ABC transporter ATP-binding protein [Paenibacillus assamensis]
MKVQLKPNEKKTVILKAEHLYKTYQTGNEEFHAAKDMSLDIYEGEFTVIMGSSGSGKSTLLYMLSGLDSVSSGSVYFKEQRIDQLSETQITALRSEEIGYVYQSINLVPDLNLYENIALPGHVAGRSNKDIRTKALYLLKLMNIEEQRDRLPSQVSGGQQQRAAIARALINSPEVIFADEPTGALNQEQGTIILDLLTEVNRDGQTIVMVTHDIKAACRADRIILIKDGQIGGILELGKYKPEQLQSREQQIFSFIAGKE